VTVAVDFDGVIHADSHAEDASCAGEPLAGALDGLRALMADHAVFVFTSRDPAQVEVWFHQHAPDIPTTYDPRDEPSAITCWNARGRLLITDRKLPATHYIDDRAVAFEDWPQALAAVNGQTAGDMLIPVRVPALAKPLAIGGVRRLSPNHPLSNRPCPVDGRALGEEPITLVHVGTRPEGRKDTGQTTGFAVPVHAVCAGLDTSGDPS